ncbi:von Willebrand factor type A domain-containing protein [Caloramator quimbayensis]|uniref:von Willebrand factor type A domain-containing protein n=1 Tax=Caloramator quimbayensis TaxID=1147123 RepID=A0A1T4WZD7_9CLOT|nr:VWA domain-containing protein [Caloramator quimbayensis]SKA82235.1 von Willebrand factor type A domain-containing protein [Caloramator quimbayensis]
MKKKFISIFLMFLFIIMQCFNNAAYASIIKDYEAEAYVFVDSSSTIAKDKEVNVVYRYYINGKAKDFDNSVPISLSYAVSDKFYYISSNLPNAVFKNQLLTASGLSKETGKYIEYNIVLKAKENIDIKNLSDLGKITVTYKNNQGNGNLKTAEAAVKIVLKDSNSSSYNDTTNLKFTAQNNKTEIYSDEKFETSFTIEPQGQVSIERKPVSIILVMDTSGSMKENSKIDKSKEAAKKLMDTIYNNRISNDKAGLVDFDTYVNNNSSNRYVYNSYGYYWGTWKTKYTTSICSSLKYIDNSTLNDYKDKINKMFAVSSISDVVGGTNLESALLLSKEYFNNDSNEKHIIVLTDGNPTFYMQSDGNIKGLGSGYDENAADKAINVLNDLKNMGVKTHFIGLKTKDNDINDDFLNAAASAGGGLKFTTKNPDEVDSIMQNIYSVINKSIVYSNINFEYVLPEGIEADKSSLPEGFKVENGKVTGQINDIEFKNNQSAPQPFNFKISFKAKKAGDIDLGEAQINYTKNSILGNSEGIRKAELGSIKVSMRDFGVDLDFNANKSSDNLYLDQELTLNYSINPKGILNLTRKPVSIVLIMDSSGSMAQIKINGRYQIIDKTDDRYVNTKMYYASESAKKLMDLIFLKSIAGDKIGLIDFDTYVNNNNCNTLIDSNSQQNINALKNKINNMYAEGGTNLEAGLLKAKEYFSLDNSGNDKYIILLTDGMPSLYFDSNGKLAGIGSSYDYTAGEEANNAAKELSRMGVKLNVIGVDTENGDVKKEYIDNLAAISGGVSYYTSNPQSIDTLMQETYKIINKSVVYENITITQDIPSGLTACSLPNGWKIENGRLTGYVENVVFENKSNKTPEAKEFTVKLKASKIGEYDLGYVTMNYSMKFDEFSTSKEPKNIYLGKVNFKLKDFSNYINFNDMQINKKIVPNKTTFTITITRNKNELYNLSNDAKVELILGTDNNKVSILSKTGNLLFDKISTSKTCSFQASIIDSSKEQSANITVKAIKITFNGESYTIDSKDEIAKYFNNKEPVQKLKVKKFSLR